jgi:hypothetical protein
MDGCDGITGEAPRLEGFEFLGAVSVATAAFELKLT